jgi:xanthine dehydrogenase accessory factor
MAIPNSLTLGQLPSLLLAAMEEGTNAAVLVAVGTLKTELLGGRLLVLPDSAEGTLGDPVADAEGIRLARRALEGEEGVLSDTIRLPLSGDGEMEAFLELHHPSPEMVIVGAGHVAQPLATMGSLLGLRIKVLDDRPEFATRERFPEASELLHVDFADPFLGIPLHPWSHVVLVTRGHKYDYECLRKILQGETLPGYVGMIGSRRRVRATFDALLREGLPRERLDLVRAPIGLDIGGETPAEIAVSVLAEIVHHGRGGTGRPLRELEHVLDRFHPMTGQIDIGEEG